MQHSEQNRGLSRRLPQHVVRAWSRPNVRWWAVVIGFVAIALVARVYGLVLQGWTPDTYEQLEAARRLSDGELPISRFYPPGVAVTFAPFFLFLPATLETMVAINIGASLLLVVVVATQVRSATRDRGAALVAAGAVALSPWFVYFSRDVTFDVVNTLWVTAAILFVPSIRRCGWLGAGFFGVMVAVACTVRATNVLVLPAVLIYWIGLAEDWTPRGIARACTRTQPVAALLTFVASYLILTFIGGNFGTAATAPVSLTHVPGNLAFNYLVCFGLQAAIVVLPLAVLGGIEVWRRSPGLALASTYMILVFPLAFAPLPYANVRYSLPAFVFTLILAAHAPAAIREWCRRRQWAADIGRMRVSRVAIAGAYCAIAFVALMFVSVDVWLVATWKDRALESDESAYREMRPYLQNVPDGSVVVGTGVLGVKDSNQRVEFIDLIDVSLRQGGNYPATVSAITSDLSAALLEGRSVFYVYTRLDEPGVSQEGDNFGRPGPGFLAYYEALDRAYEMKPVVETDVDYFTLFQVLPEGASTTR